MSTPTDPAQGVHARITDPLPALALRCGHCHGTRRIAPWQKARLWECADCGRYWPRTTQTPPTD